MKVLSPKTILFTVLFFVSGMTGLVYESVWAQYIRIVAGHSAFAQSFILVIFLSGLAIGAWYAGKIIKKVKNLFLFYSFIEFAIGLFALIFHPVFTFVNHFLFEFLYPNYAATVVEVLKWIFAIAITLPQTILIGSTFPVLTQAFARIIPVNKDKIVPHLYFINSLGAAIGVFVSGFFLVSIVGLPGSMIISGVTNLVIAVLSVFGSVFIKNNQTELQSKIFQPEIGKTTKASEFRLQRSTFSMLIVLGALVTGATSFIYEIGWLRMLSMTLGSTTHAFELMLSAFILGLALGSLWIKYRINKIKKVLTYFAVAQILMGVLAVLSIVGYNATFDIMSWLLGSLQRTENGYFLFMAGTHFLALFVMLPATICAGMSLPLLINLFQQIDFEEDAIGKIYAVNTSGGIIGVLAGIHLLLPFFGVKYLLVIAGTLDVMTGMVFFLIQNEVRLSKFLSISLPGLILFLFVSIFFIQTNPQKMTSGVYRYGNINRSNEILFEKDGKTATISVYQTKNGNIVLTTNGKPDASVNIYRQISGDEATQVLLAVLPMSFNYYPENVGIIGLGSGKTAHTMLSNFSVKQVEVVEIEPFVYEASWFFKDYVNNIFQDPRFNIHFADAKTFFSSNQKKYDLIISEPSNPWISGIGSLFSEGFYKSINKSLSENGLFVQWIQTYEMTVPLIASIVKALSPNFEDYRIYFLDDGDLAIVGKKKGKMKTDYKEIFKNIELQFELSRLGIASSHDFAIREIGNKEILDPFFATFPVSANSDFHPFLEYQAGKAGFFQLSAGNLDQLLTFPAPVIYSLMNQALPESGEIGSNLPYQLAGKFRNAEAVYWIFDSIQKGYHPVYKGIDDKMLLLINTIRRIENVADSSFFSISRSSFLSSFAKEIMPFLTDIKLDIIWNYVQNANGFSGIPEKVKHQILFYHAVSQQDYKKIIELTDNLHFDELTLTFLEVEYFYTCRIWAFLMLSEQEKALKLWEIYPKQNEAPFILRLLGSLAEQRSGVEISKISSKTEE